MKKILFIAASAMLVLASCTNDESAPEIQEVGFNAIVKKGTKAVITNNVFPTDQTFKIWGFYSPLTDFSEFTDAADKTNFMKGVEISYVTAEETWRNSESRYYWPTGGKVGFYALYPSTIDINAAPNTLTWTGGATISNYAISGQNKEVDLMYGYSSGDKTTGANNGKMGLVFYHALSQVVFNIQTAATYADAHIYVKGITLKKVDLDGTFNYKYSANANTTEETWLNKDISVSWSGNDNSSLDENSLINYFTTTTNHEFEATFPVAPATVAQFGNPIVMIPQDITTGTKAYVNFTLEQNNSDVIEYTIPITLVPVGNSWVEGKRYIYTIKFKLEEILINPSVNTWVDVTVAANEI